MTFFTQKKYLAYLFIIFCALVFLQGIFQLPVMDRDEARFATSSKTMIETSDFIDIKMHDEVRYKKPIGIYWAQVVSNITFSSYPYDKIWAYRIPSLFGVVFSLLLICDLCYFWIGELAEIKVIFIKLMMVINYLIIFHHQLCNYLGKTND